MTITLQDSAGTNQVVLVHGPANATDSYAQGPLGDGETFEAQQAVVVSRPIRAAAAVVRARGTRSASYPFSALREFSTAAAARVWAAAHAAAVCTQTHTRLVLADGSGNTQTLAGALVSAVCRVRGVSVSIAYEFHYGATTYTEPE